MKLLKMKCIADKAIGDEVLEPENQEVHYMVKLEKDGEEDIYNTFGASHILFQSMLGGMREHVAEKEITDDNVVYYFMSAEQEPGMGETFELDDTKWERVG